MLRLISWVISLALAFGVGDAFVTMTRDMMHAAAGAHQHDQMSYAKFTRELTAPRSVKRRRH